MIIMDEAEYAKECVEAGELGDKPYYTMAAMSKYLYQIRGLSENAIINFLFSLLEVSGSYYWNKRRFWQKEINEIVKQHKEDKIYTIREVAVTKSEWEKIVGINNSTLERLAFTILVLAKFYDLKREEPNGWLNLKTKEIFDIAGCNCQVIEQDKYLNRLMKLGLIEFPVKSTNLSIRVVFIDNESEVFAKINDLRALGFEYRNLKGEDLMRCQKCGVLTNKNKNGTKKYCAKCAKYQTQKNRKVICADCNKTFSVPSSNHKTTRCPECYRKFRKEQRRISAESKQPPDDQTDKSILR
jgi:hypothetical protein